MGFLINFSFYPNLLVPRRCDQADIDEIERHINTENEDESDPIYQEYFEYCSAMLGFQEPNT